MSQSFKVPINNLFYLLSYANDMPEMIDSLNDVEDDLITYNFLAEQFNLEVKKLIRSGLVKSYVAQVEETDRLSGRLLLNESMSFIVGRQPVVVCEKDEFTEDILFNQIIKVTLEGIYRNQRIKEGLRRESFILWERLANVSPLFLTKDIFLRIHYYRHDVHYKRMIQVAHLLYELDLLSHNSGEWDLYSVRMSERDLNKLFETFLFNFYKLEQDDYRVHGEHLYWKLEGNKSFLPRMETDVSMTHKNGYEKIIIDAKFYKHMFQINHGKSSFHSGNMYQMFTYLKHQPVELDVRGILIYPYNGHEIKEVYHYDKRISLEVMTVNLFAKWRDIYIELLAIVE